MDPEAGDGRREEGTAPEQRDRSVVQALFQALVLRLQAIIGALAPGREVGVENRYYYDETEKQWKLRGGETEQERAEAEAIRFHTSRGMNSTAAPPTTACDASRGAGVADAVPPPPTGGFVSQSLHAPPPTADGRQLASLSHPVYAPQGLGVGSEGAAVAPPSDVTGAPPVARTTPFGAPPVALASPFGAAAGATAAPQQVRSSPFGTAGSAGGPVSQQPMTSPFGGAPGGQSLQPLTSPFGGAPHDAVAPGGQSLRPLTSPFGSA